jgi:hypothetical protein
MCARIFVCVGGVAKICFNPLLSDNLQNHKSFPLFRTIRVEISQIIVILGAISFILLISCYAFKDK